MTNNSDIRDQAYQFFLEEAPELLQLIEGVLLTLRYERSIGKVHDLMRAAHSLKGGAASIGLEAISTLAHHLETIFKALYNESLEIDNELEGQLLQAYDCLRVPLRELFDNGHFNSEQALAVAQPIFEQLEEQLEDSIKQTENYIPSSSELGINLAEQIFAVDVVDGLTHLEEIVTNSQDYNLVEELRTQIEVFSGFAELLNLPGFGAIAETTMMALDTHPEQALEIAKLALNDFQKSQQAVLVNHDSQGGEPSTALLAFTNEQSWEFSVETDSSNYSYQEALADSLLQLPQAQEADTEQEQFQQPSSQTFSTEEETALLSLEELFSSELITNQADTELFSPSNIVEGELMAETDCLNEQLAEALPSLDDVFGEVFTNQETEIATSNSLVPTTPSSPTVFESADRPENLEAAIESIVDAFETLPALDKLNITIPQENLDSFPVTEKTKQVSAKSPQNKVPAKPKLSVRVDSERLERMNNLVGELAISRSGVSLQNGQLQVAVNDLRNRFARLQDLVGHLRELSDQMLVSPERSSHNLHFTASSRAMVPVGEKKEPSTLLPTTPSPLANKTNFDSLEMDNYGALHSVLQNFLEDMMQLEESVDDIGLFAGQSNDILEQQQQMLTHLRDELIWARMLPIGEVLNRFPRVLRDLAATYHKPVSLKLTGTGVLVDKAVLEKIYDPLLHLLRNAFDHGIEFPENRLEQGKPEQSEIEIRAYHQGGQTIIEVKDNGRGVDLERIRHRALEMGLLPEEKLTNASERQLFDLMFEPGFSTAEQVSEISGRGVGLDVVRAQLRTLNGNISVTSKPGVGTTFALRLPLTQTIAKLLVGLVGQSAIALPADSVEEIVVPRTGQIKKTGSAQFLYWRGQIVPTYRLADLLDYACPLPTRTPNKALAAVPTPDDWAAPLLVLQQGQQVFALQIDRLVTEQELVIKPFGAALTPPSYTYGCTILGGGTLVPVVNGATLLNRFLNQEEAPLLLKNKFQAQDSLEISSNQTTAEQTTLVNFAQNQAPNLVKSEPTAVLVVDDAVTLRRTLALSLEKAGYRVLQAGDGREAIKRLEQNSQVKLVVCDIEMPNMNGFDFLSHRRQDPQLQAIPVVMLTSRGSHKHRWLAMHLGATAYFSKPYIEQEFIKSIKEVIVANG
ncbi:MAG: response regulator [Coleofasciculaceae cyanobacterium]